MDFLPVVAMPEADTNLATALVAPTAAYPQTALLAPAPTVVAPATDAPPALPTLTSRGSG